MTEEQILQEATKIIKDKFADKDSAVAQLKNLLGQAKLQTTRDEILQQAGDYKQWDLVQFMCVTYSFDQNVIDKIISTLSKESFNKDIIKDTFAILCHSSVIKPSLSIINETWKFALAKQQPDWNFIGYLYSLKNTYPPSKTIISLLLDKAAYKKDWSWIKWICLDKDNPPAPYAVEAALEAVPYEDLEKLKFICEQSIVPPGQEAIETFFKRALSGTEDPEGFKKPEWALIEYLCELTTNFKPKQPYASNEAIVTAAAKNRWDVVSNICFNENNPPTHIGIDVALVWAPKSNDVEGNLGFLFTQSPIKPSNKAIEDLLTAEVNKPDSNLIYILCDVNTEMASKALVIAAAKNDWTKVASICVNNSPSQNAIDETLLCALDSGKYAFDNIDFICKESPIKPTQKGIDALLTKALKEVDSIHNQRRNEATQKGINALLTLENEAWRIIKYLYFLERIVTADKTAIASQSAIDKVLKKAIFASEHWDLVKKLCSNQKNPPSPEAIDYVFYYSFSVEELEFFCEKSFISPSREGIEKLLNNMLDDSPPKWSCVTYLCTLRGPNKPTSTVIDAAVKKACKQGEWDVVKAIYKMQGDNKPTQDAIDALLLSAAINNQLSIVEDLKQFPPEQRRPTNSAFEKALISASRSGSLEMVNSLYTVNENQDFSLAFLEAIRFSDFSIMHYFNEQSKKLPASSNPLSTEVIEKAIKITTNQDKEPLDFFKYLLEQAVNKPGAQALNEAYITALSKGYDTFVAFLTNPDENELYYTDPQKTELTLRQETLDFGLSKAVTVKNGLEMITHLVTKTTGLFTKKGFQLAIEAANNLDANTITNKKAIVALLEEGYKNYSFSSQSYKPYVEPEKISPAAPSAKNAQSGQPIKVDKTSSQKPQAPKLSGGPETKAPPPKVPGDTSPPVQNQKTEAKSNPLEPEHKPFAPHPPPTAPTQVGAGFSTLPHEVIADTLSNAVQANDLETVKRLCALVTKNKPNAQEIKQAIAMTSNPEIKKCLVIAQGVLNLHEHIQKLKEHAKTLANDKKSEVHGEEALVFAAALKKLTNKYAASYFSNGIDLPAIKTDFKSTFELGYNAMNTHRAEWKITLLNILTVASLIGLAINYAVNKQFLFSNTKRQDLIQGANKEFEKLDKDMENNKSQPK